MRDGVLHAVQRPSPESSVYPEIELKPGSSRNAETRSSNSQERTTVRAATPLITESGACYPEFGGQKFVNHPCTPASTRTRYRCAPSSRNDRHRPAPPHARNSHLEPPAGRRASKIGIARATSVLTPRQSVAFRQLQDSTGHRRQFIVGEAGVPPSIMRSPPASNPLSSVITARVGPPTGPSPTSISGAGSAPPVIRYPDRTG